MNITLDISTDLMMKITKAYQQSEADISLEEYMLDLLDQAADQNIDDAIEAPSTEETSSAGSLSEQWKASIRAHAKKVIESAKEQEPKAPDFTQEPFLSLTRPIDGRMLAGIQCRDYPSVLLKSLKHRKLNGELPTEDNATDILKRAGFTVVEWPSEEDAEAIMEQYKKARGDQGNCYCLECELKRLLEAERKDPK
ncbi:MAG: hypothetical protein [Bacteriophage sp.]|nr:MAG: hypothetical protein [Bacteriophage sp.]